MRTPRCLMGFRQDSSDVVTSTLRGLRKNSIVSSLWVMTEQSRSGCWNHLLATHHNSNPCQHTAQPLPTSDIDSHANFGFPLKFFNPDIQQLTKGSKNCVKQLKCGRGGKCWKLVGQRWQTKRCWYVPIKLGPY